MAGLWAQAQPSSEFGVKLVRVAGLDLDGGGTLFVRYYVPAGDGTRWLRVDKREIPCGGEAFWGEVARFELWDCGAAMAPAADAGSKTPAALGGGIVFELRWRPPPPSSSGLAAWLVTATGKGRRQSSRALARAELVWEEVATSKPAERWLTLSRTTGRELSGCKAPKLLVEIDIVHAAVADDLEVRGRKVSGVDTCCGAGEYCCQCRWVGSEEDMFLAATFSQ